MMTSSALVTPRFTTRRRAGPLAALALLLTATPVEAQDVAFIGVRLFDGDSVRHGATVVVREGTIAAVGTDLPLPDGIPTVDGRGRTLLPGLIDAHSHAFSEDQLATALAFGITTELDQFGTPSFLRDTRTAQEAREVTDRADHFGAGIVATAPGGHGTQFGREIPTLASPDQAEGFVADRIAEGSNWLKIIRTDPSMRRPTLDLEIIRALIAAAHAQGIRAVVHVSTVDDALAMVEMGADGIVHTAEDRMPEPDFGERFAATGAFVVPTLTVIWGAATGGEGPSQLADPLLRPWLDAEQRSSLERAFPTRGDGELQVAAAAETVRQMRAAGVRILAGSDAPNPNTAHGASLHRELENLVRAGLTPREALVAATSAPAEAFGLEDRGRVTPGRRADLLLVEGDPTADITATKRIVGVWKGGVRYDREARRARLGAEGAGDPNGAQQRLRSGFRTVTPVSSSVSRAAALAGDSPYSSRPPGVDHRSR